MDNKIKSIMKQETRIPDSITKHIENTLYHLPETKQVSKKSNVIFFFNQSYIKVAAIALVCILSLGTTAYAAAKHFGLIDFLGKRGMTEVETTEMLVQEELMEQVYIASNEYATYTLKEAVCDSELIYMVVEVSPKSESYLLVMEDCMPEDPVQNLFIDGLTEGTIQEYANEQGKELVYVGMGLFKEDELISCTLDAKGTTDGKLYYCMTSTNGYKSTELNLRFMGTATLGIAQTMDDISRCNLEVSLKNTGTKENKVYLPVMENIWEKSGITLKQIEISETKLGLYATYIYQANQLMEEQHINFVLGDKDGNKCDFMPYYINGREEAMDDGYKKVTYAYQKPDSLDGLQLFIDGLGEEFDSVPIELINQE